MPGVYAEQKVDHTCSEKHPSSFDNPKEEKMHMQKKTDTVYIVRERERERESVVHK